MKKLTPSQQMGKFIEMLIKGEVETENLLAEVLRRGTESILQHGLEAEVTDFLGREHYEHSGEGRHRGYRNGYQEKRFKTAEGSLTVKRPRVRETEEVFESRILRHLDGMEARLRRLVVEMYVGGLSTRDIEQTLVDEDGSALLSRSSVSRMTEALYAEYAAWREQDLSVFDVVYLFLDGVYESVRHYTHNQAILCAWGITSKGEKVLLHLGCASSESEEAWTMFLEEMVDRGVSHPLLVVTDGSKALKKAVIKTFPHSDRQRCLAHKMRNLLAKVPIDKREELHTRAKGVYYCGDPDLAELLAGRFIEDYAEKYPSMVSCFSDDLEACLVHLKYPKAHHRYIRTTNLIERSFVEQKRRTKVLPDHVSEKAAMKLVFAVLIRAAKRWIRIKMTSTELTYLKNIRAMICPHDRNEDQTISFRIAA